MPDLTPHFAETLALLRLSDPAGDTWRDIETRYTETGRHYHTLDHVAQCLDQLAGTAHDTPLLRLAFYYHDIIYDPCGDNNELLSARFATDSLTRLGLPDAKTAVVYDLIRATDHGNSPPVPHSGLIRDIDLAILGAEPGDYEEYATAIRREYGWLPDHKFNRGRINILLHFLNRPAIYETEAFHTRLEDQARRNLTNEIIRLRG
jgi:predicted metal-dependent HD superfamily phosphohydrolase